MSPKISDEEKQQRRQQIILAAMEVFKKKGYESATMGDIVEETGMSRGWVYLYFSSKEEIFRAMVDELDDQNGENMQRLLEETGSVWEALNAMLTIQEQEWEENMNPMVPVIYEYFVGGWREENRRIYLLERYEKQSKMVHAFFQKGIARGEFHPDIDIDLIIKLISGYLDGLHVHAQVVGFKQLRVKEQMDILRRNLYDLLHVHSK
ncbi:TetR family transcriptional regulator [Microbacteriaceae bacterium 4G12]